MWPGGDPGDLEDSADAVEGFRVLFEHGFGAVGELAEELTRAREERIKWEVDAVVPDDRPEIPGIGQSFGGMFVGRRLSSKIKKINEANERREKNDGR